MALFELNWFNGSVQSAGFDVKMIKLFYSWRNGIACAILKCAGIIFKTYNWHNYVTFTKLKLYKIILWNYLISESRWRYWSKISIRLVYAYLSWGFTFIQETLFCHLLVIKLIFSLYDVIILCIKGMLNDVKHHY